MQVYQEGVDDQAGKDKDEHDGSGEKFLPNFTEKEVVLLNAVKPNQHFTEPPPRYSEATLVKSLEEHGIGRPSTYATIISTLQHRKYVTLEAKRFHPTDVGIVVNKFLTSYFTKYVDYGFTAALEDSLDEISRDEKQWIPLMREFWDPFVGLVRDVEKNVQRSDVTNEIIEEKCPECSKSLSIRLGKNGRFIGCTGYPECKYTRNVDGSSKDSKEAQEVEAVADRVCPKCSSTLIVRNGKYGKFIGCSTYPKCNFIESLAKPEDTNVGCPECKQGSLIKRKSRYGTFFYSCNSYPKCKYLIKYPPLDKACPQCAWPILMHKTSKRSGNEEVCPHKGCGYSKTVD
jgi:DNA topoisomerase-1